MAVSGDLDELTACDRVEAVFRGRITKTLKRGWSEHDVVAATEGL